MKSELILVYCSVHVARVAGTEFLARQMLLYVRTEETRGPRGPFQVYKIIKATPIALALFALGYKVEIFFHSFKETINCNCGWSQRVSLSLW